MKRFALAVVLALSVVPAAADAADPGVWLKTSQLTKPAYYRQGIASNPATKDVFFSGSFAGLYRTRNGAELAKNTSPIPPDVVQREKYNHIGDIDFDARDGGQLLLPLESYAPFEQDQNPSDTGSIGVTDATTLKWKYYVKLDPSEIAKVQWVAVDAANDLVWTITDHDLLAYNLADINPANAQPAAAPIHSVRRLPNAAPDGAGGAIVFGGRIYLSTLHGDVNQVVSVDANTGASQVEIEAPGTLEAEGLDVGGYFDGLLHWELVPGGGLSNTQVLNFLPKGAKLSLKLNKKRIKGRKKTTVVADATAVTNGQRIPLSGVEIRLAGKRAKTNDAGRAKLRVKPAPGVYRAQAFYKGLRTATTRIRATSR